jgi:D-serine deaminase-like pyridoxal phosphate-dependent protein
VREQAAATAAAGMAPAGARAALPSPALLIELDALDANISRMAAHAATAGVGLRPHAKAHKSAVIAARLVHAGAIGASCATIGEAEAMAAGGIGGLLVTSPVVGGDALARLGRLLLRDAEVMVVADDPGNVRDLAGAAADAGMRLPVLVDLDVGQGRTGCADVEAAEALAGEVAEQAALEFAGVQAYWGNLQQVTPFAERRARVEEQARKLRTLIERLGAAGRPPLIVTGGGTGTSFIDPGLGLFTELQPGSYLLMDSSYGAVAIDGSGPGFAPSLFVSALVVSASRPGRSIVNAGFKALATDSGRPAPVRGAPPGASYTFMGDEHGAIDFDPGAGDLRVGDRVELLTSHCDPTVNLHGRYAVVRGEDVLDFWPIEARY